MKDPTPFKLSRKNREFRDSVLEKVPTSHRKALKTFIEEKLRELQLGEEFADEFIQSGLWKNTSDVELIGFLFQQDISGDAEERPLEQMSRRLILETGLEFQDREQERGFRAFVSRAFQISLTTEFEERFKDREAEGGRLLRDFLNRRDEASLRALIAWGTGQTHRHKLSLYWHPEYGPGSKARQEISSMVAEALWERISQLPDFKDSLRQRLERMLQGAYNRIPENAYASVLEKLRRLKDRASKTLPLEGHQAGDDADPVLEHQVLRENALVRSQLEEEFRTLRTSIASHPDLSRQDKQVCKLMIEGFTQSEIGKKLGKSQQALSKQLKKINSKLK